MSTHVEPRRDVGTLGFSNFGAWYVKVGDIVFPTLEHAYQAYKTEDEGYKRAIADAHTPGQAKRIGNNVPLIRDWEVRKLLFMWELLNLKFAPGTDWAENLFHTDGQLVEWNTWHDTFWGVCTCPSHQGKGENMLGKMLTWIRESYNA